jgi:hypothetical protein
MKELPKVYIPLSPERLCEVINELFDVRNPDGTPGKCTPELAERIMKMPEFFEQLPPVPSDGIVGGHG